MRIFAILILIILSINLGHSSDPIDNIVSVYLSDKDEFKKRIFSVLEDNNSTNEAIALAKALSVLSLDPTKELDSIETVILQTENCITTRCKAYTAMARCRIPLVQEKGREAIDLALTAIHNLNAEQDPHLWTLMHQTSAVCYYWMGDYIRAGQYVNIALDKALELSDAYSIAAAYDLLANGWSGTNDIRADSFRQLYYTAIEAIDDFDYTFTKYTTQGFSLQNQDFDDSARVYFQLAFDLAVDSGEQVSELEALTYLAENSFWRKEYKETREQYERALTYPEDLLDEPGAARAYDFWSQAEAALGNHKKAYEYMRLYKETDDEYWDYASRAQTNELEAKYENANKEALLAQQQLQLERRTSQRNLAYTGGLGLLMLGGFFFYRNRQKQLLSASKIENLEKQQQLIALDYMVQGQEEERKRIAQDLHDGLGGLLSSARMQMQVIHREMEKFTGMDLFAKAETMIDTACTEVRRIAHDMMPGALIDLGLVDAVEDLLTKTTQKHTLQYQFAHPDEIEISDLQSIQLYRIVQEIINNIVKHASAKNINCSIADDGKNINLKLSDDGVGFQMTEALKKDGIGLQNIQSRIRYLNGALAFESEPQGGTTYNIKIPK